MTLTPYTTNELRELTRERDALRSLLEGIAGDIHREARSIECSEQSCGFSVCESARRILALVEGSLAAVRKELEGRDE